MRLENKSDTFSLDSSTDIFHLPLSSLLFPPQPRKDKLLSTSNDLLAPNLNRASAPSQPSLDDEGSRFGPDRGRGGRLPRGGRGGAESGSSRGGAGGERGGATRGRGTNSGNDRGARQKEKRGNSARQRGFDKKVARGGAGTGGL